MQTRWGARIIPRTSFTVGEAKTLTRLLGLVAQDNGYWPTQECFLAADRAVCRPAAEIVITDPSWPELEKTATVTQPPKVLLCLYETDGAKGGFGPHWTLPGGRIGISEGIRETCMRVGRKEIIADVYFLGEILTTHKWEKGEHPDGGRPLSLYAKCAAAGLTEVPIKRRFFPVNALPELRNPDGVHCRNLAEIFARLFPEFFPLAKA